MDNRARKINFDLPISELFPQKKYRGEIGIEVEVEGQHFPKAVPSYWKYVKDGSLRGADNAEYILKQPCTRRSVKKFCEYLFKFLADKGARIDESNRTSVHVHINYNNRTLSQCYTAIILYMIVEDLMARIAGAARVGNLFCLRAKDAEWFVDHLANCARKRQFNPDPERTRYTAVNVCAIQKFNSIEFRALRGTTDPKVITEWTELLLAIKDAAGEYQYPTDIVNDFSRLGPEGFLRKVFPDHHKLFTAQRGYAEDMWDGLRLVQEIAFATDWTKEDKPKRMFDVYEGE